ncbi:hypothetical protein MKW94_009578 [Papaver nudicaule]|uniref:Uncharacterized protein n=1 Tax=Papaver nudicaule TaxID=74823 RepID=A0AA41UZ98_PAPNU|nr:hypothetical protein [Papaver nudicaule]
MAKFFCASPVFIAAFLLLLITASVSSECRFPGGAKGVVQEGRSKKGCAGCARNCLSKCGNSKYRIVYETCEFIEADTLICNCCCSNKHKLSSDQ